jgi:hypothetical protein
MYHGSMADIQITKVEEHPDGRLLFSVLIYANKGKKAPPLAVQDEGTATRNETAVVGLTLRFAEVMAEAIRSRLGI